MRGLFQKYSDKIFLAGIVFIFLGALVFLGATPRGQKANAVGEAWSLAAPMIFIGLILLGVNWYFNR